MSRSAKIAEIIDKRKPLAQRIETAIGNLEALRGALKSIEMKRKELLPKLKDETAKDKLEGIDFISAHDAITSQLVHLEKLEARFARKTLNVGVIGMMRQGKSTLLQSLTGLDNNVIPAKSGGVCTAVRSKIRHQPHGETQAIVSFHSESSFVNEVLKPYYNDLSLTPVPHTLADFIYSELPSLKPENTSQQQAIYNRFVDDYYKNRHSLQKYLKPTEVKEAIAIDKIQEYVTGVTHLNLYSSLQKKCHLQIFSVKGIFLNTFWFTRTHSEFISVTAYNYNFFLCYQRERLKANFLHSQEKMAYIDFFCSLGYKTSPLPA